MRKVQTVSQYKKKNKREGNTQRATDSLIYYNTTAWFMDGTGGDTQQEVRQ